jgi:hypothetical protein
MIELVYVMHLTILLESKQSQLIGMLQGILFYLPSNLSLLISLGEKCEKSYLNEESSV